MLDAYTQAAFGDLTAQPVLPDVQAALARLRSEPIHPGFTPDTSRSYPFFFRPETSVNLLAHIQGVARLSVPGHENWFAFSKHHVRKPRQAGILLVRWSKVPARGNLVRQDAPASGAGDGRVQASVFGRSAHPGGIQLCGSILAVAQSNDNEQPWIDFFNLKQPDQPSILARLTLAAPLVPEPPRAITSVALTRNGDGKYLCFVYRYSSKNAGGQKGWLFVTDTSFLNANSRWELARVFDKSSFPAEWREEYENVTFIGQSDGALFLAGLRGFQTDNHVDLFRLAESPIRVHYAATKLVATRPGGATFRAGASLYVTRGAQLALYASQKSSAGGKRLLVEEFGG